VALKIQERQNYRYFPTKSEDIKLEMKTKIRNKSAQNNLKMQGRFLSYCMKLKINQHRKTKELPQLIISE